MPNISVKTQYVVYAKRGHEICYIINITLLFSVVNAKTVNFLSFQNKNNNIFIGGKFTRCRFSLQKVAKTTQKSRKNRPIGGLLRLYTALIFDTFLLADFLYDFFVTFILREVVLFADKLIGHILLFNVSAEIVRI